MPMAVKIGGGASVRLSFFVGGVGRNLCRLVRP
jgi:hypothetical protein